MNKKFIITGLTIILLATLASASTYTWNISNYFYQKESGNIAASSYEGDFSLSQMGLNYGLLTLVIMRQ